MRSTVLFSPLRRVADFCSWSVHYRGGRYCQYNNLLPDFTTLKYLYEVTFYSLAGVLLEQSAIMFYSQKHNLQVNEKMRTNDSKSRDQLKNTDLKLCTCAFRSRSSLLDSTLESSCHFFTNRPFHSKFSGNAATRM
jgi:hypothetical protein